MGTSSPLAHLNVVFQLDGVEYNVERFKIGFKQPVDHKGQPQHEVGGGQLAITLSHAGDNTLYEWAKNSVKLKDGVVIFQTQMKQTVMRVSFNNGYCVGLTRTIDAQKGTQTSLVISPEKVSVNGHEHTNDWY